MLYTTPVGDAMKNNLMLFIIAPFAGLCIGMILAYVMAETIDSAFHFIIRWITIAFATIYWMSLGCTVGVQVAWIDSKGVRKEINFYPL